MHCPASLLHTVSWSFVQKQHLHFRVYCKFHPSPIFFMLYFCTRGQPACYPRYAPLINNTEVFFSSLRWKVYDHHPHTTKCASNERWTPEWSCRRFPEMRQKCLAKEEIWCNEDENLLLNSTIDMFDLHCYILYSGISICTRPLYNCAI